MSIPILSRAGGALAGSGTIKMAQGPVQPWANDDEAEAYAKDPKSFLLAKCANFMSAIELFRDNVMLATYYLPAFEILPGGRRFHRADVTLDEATYQGKVGLVIAVGPLAFVDDGRLKFGGQKVEIGDWVYFDRHDGRQLTIHRVHCRRLKDVEVIGRASDPNLVY
jgi:co-chaperonin GroES (HSP10)